MLFSPSIRLFASTLSYGRVLKLSFRFFFLLFKDFFFCISTADANLHPLRTVALSTFSSYISFFFFFRFIHPRYTPSRRDSCESIIVATSRITSRTLCVVFIRVIASDPAMANHSDDYKDLYPLSVPLAHTLFFVLSFAFCPFLFFPRFLSYISKSYEGTCTLH